MVGIINQSRSIRNSFYYNEAKVKKGYAECLMAENYPGRVEDLTNGIKLKLLHKMAALNERAKVNCVHISLNFHPSDSIMPEELKEIARFYMRKIGFGNQPYLVYRHQDAGHPHLHIVSTHIKIDGKKIDIGPGVIRNAGLARKEVESHYRLAQAGSKLLRTVRLAPIPPGKVSYGQFDSTRAIAKVLDHILPEYNYTTLDELNAVLNRYNILADRCKENTRIYQNRGLLYRILDANGKFIGVPIKASSFYQKPTLKYLEERFAFNRSNRNQYKAHIRVMVNFYFLKRDARPSLRALINTLRMAAIHPVLIQKDQKMPEIIYVDHKSKCAVHETGLSEIPSASAILERCGLDGVVTQKFKVESLLKTNADQLQLKEGMPDQSKADIGSVF